MGYSFFDLIRFEEVDTDFKAREETLQHDLENAASREAKLVERCDEMESLYHDTRRQKDEQNFELNQILERATTLERRLKEVEDDKTDLEFDLSEMQNSLAKCMKPLAGVSGVKTGVGVSSLNGVADDKNGKILSYSAKIS